MRFIHYLNGNFVEEKDLVVSARDLGYTRGYSVFDFFRTYNGQKPFMFNDYLERFITSASRIGLALPWSKDEIKKIITDTLERNRKDFEYVVKIIASGGPSFGIMPPDTPTLIVIVDKAIDFPEKLYLEGIKVKTLHYQRYRPDTKTTHYIEAVKHMKLFSADGAEEILYIDNDLVLEGAFSNFFCVYQSKVITAKENILNGITRKIVLEKLKLPVSIEIKDLSLKELQKASEAFITVSGKGIVPVVMVDDNKIGSGQVGPITKEVILKFKEFVESNQW